MIELLAIVLGFIITVAILRENDKIHSTKQLRTYIIWVMIAFAILVGLVLFGMFTGVGG